MFSSVVDGIIGNELTIPESMYSEFAIKNAQANWDFWLLVMN